MEPHPEDLKSLELLDIIQGNLDLDALDYYFEVFDLLAVSKKYSKHFQGSLPDYETFQRIPFPIEKLEKLSVKFHSSDKLKIEVKKLIKRISSLESKERSEYPIVISGEFNEGKLTFEELILAEEPKPQELLLEVNITFDSLNNLIREFREKSVSGTNCFIFCHNHPNLTESESSDQMATIFEEDFVNQNLLKKPGFNLSTGDIEQFVFLKNHFSKTENLKDIKFLYGVFMPDGKIVVLDIIDSDEGSKIVRLVKANK